MLSGIVVVQLHCQPFRVSYEEEISMTRSSKPLRGFAAMDPMRQRQLASKGGQAAHANGLAHQFTADEARAAGRKGGQAVSKSREHMAMIGKKGGKVSGITRKSLA
jgi:uncharacterized protein